MKDQQRPPLDHHDNCTFAVSVDWDAAQITLEGPPAGPGGGASLIPVPGVELVFDRAEGRLSQVVVEAGEPFGPVVPGEPVLAYLGRLLGDRVAAALRQAPYGTVPPVMPRPHPTVIAALSRLAGLESARRTTPVPCSPLWTMEAADLARQGRCAFRSRPYGTAPSVRPRGRRPACRGRPGQQSLSGWLDPALVPPGVFRYGLSPDSDLDIRVHDDEDPLITVETRLARGVGWSALASCRVRLVDSDARRILAVFPAPPRHDARAELRGPAGGPPPHPRRGGHAVGRGGGRREAPGARHPAAADAPGPALGRRGPARGQPPGRPRSRPYRRAMGPASRAGLGPLPRGLVRGR